MENAKIILFDVEGKYADTPGKYLTKDLQLFDSYLKGFNKEVGALYEANVPCRIVLLDGKILSIEELSLL